MISKQELQQFRTKVDDIKADMRFLTQKLQEYQIKKSEAEVFGTDALEARAIIQSVAKNTQKLLEERFSYLVTMAIQSIFQDDREFKIEFVEKRNKTELECFILKDGNRVGVYDGGGGQIHIISLASRIAFWNLSKESRPIFFLDEPISFLHSPLYLERASEMLKMLSTKLGLQFIIVSDQQDIDCDRKFEVMDGNVRVV